MSARHMVVGICTIMALAAANNASRANPYLVQTSCDTVSVDPIQVKFDFTVVNPDPFTVCRVRLHPIDSEDPPYPACSINACGSPADPWFCFGPPWTTVWEGLSEGPDELEACAGPGESVSGFSITIDPQGCCYVAAYFEPLSLEAFYWETVCFLCDETVQIQSSTWGRVKVLYR